MANYYKNYLTFFCKPIFRTIFFDSIIQNYGEAKAEIYYNIHYCKKKKKKKSIERLKTIFSDTIKKDIENDPVLTQGNNDDIQESISLSIDQSRMSITKNSVEASLISILNGMNEQKQRKKKPYVKPLNDNLILSSNRMNQIKPSSERIKSPKKQKEVNTRKNESKKIEKNPSLKSQSNIYTKPLITSCTLEHCKEKGNIKGVHHSKFNSMHVQTISNNYTPSINTYNKILKQSVPRASYSKTRKSKISFNSKSPSLPKSPRNDLVSSNNLNVNNIMKLTLKICQKKSMHTRSQSGTNQVNQVSPTINNFNININNHFCVNNSNTNNSKSVKSNTDRKKAQKKNKIDFDQLIEMNKKIISRNKTKNLVRTNTENNRYSQILNNKVFMSLVSSGVKRSKFSAMSPNKRTKEGKPSDKLMIPFGKE